MTEHDVRSEFFRLCQEVTSKHTPSAGEPALEGPLLNVLEYVKANPQSRVIFVKCFVDLVTGKAGPYSYWISLFCMRELRFPEVRQALNDHFDAVGRPPRLMNYVSDLNWVYADEPWEDAIWFRYFWEKEHPGEPWPIEAERPNA